MSNYHSNIVQTSDGGYASSILHSLVKTDSAGKVSWSKFILSSAVGDLLVETDDGGYALTVFTNQNDFGPDFWLVRTDSTGNQLWSKTYGGTGTDVAYSLIKTSDGGFALAGSTDSFGAGGTDFWLVKVDADGVKQDNTVLTAVNGTSSYYVSTLAGVHSGSLVSNGTYPGWCVDKSTNMVRDRGHDVALYSSLSNNLPKDISGFNWHAINYILNHKQGSMKQIQDAIWYFTDNQLPLANETDAYAMINGALANPTYTPASGNILAVIAYSGSTSGVQNTIVEYTIP